MNLPISLTVLIIILTAGVSLFAMNNPDVQQKLMLNPYTVSRKKEYYRFITSGFVHADFMHLGFNMFSFYFFGTLIEMFLGPLQFVLLYIAAIVLSDIPTYLKYKNNPGYNSLGASGGVSAIIFSSILIAPVNDIYIYGIPVKAFLFGFLYLIFTFYMDRRSKDHVNHSAHLYGAVTGIVYTAIVKPYLVLDFFSKISAWMESFIH